MLVSGQADLGFSHWTGPQARSGIFERYGRLLRQRAPPPGGCPSE
jgi:hypothetical protein